MSSLHFSSLHPGRTVYNGSIESTTGHQAMRTAHRIATNSAYEQKLVAALELATAILEEKLGLDVCLQAQRQPGWAGTDAHHAGMYCHTGKGKTDEPQLVKINFRNLSGFNTKAVLSVLGHEMRHAEQFKLGLFNKFHSWVGPKQAAVSSFETTRRSTWFNLPEEQDAMAHQDAYANMVINDPRFAAFKTALDVEGTVPMKKDYDGTFIALGFTGVDDPLLQVFRNRDDTVMWMNLRQVDAKAKKWTRKTKDLAWTLKDLMTSQTFSYKQVPVTLADLIS